MLDAIMTFASGALTGMIGAAFWEAFCEVTRRQRRETVKRIAVRAMKAAPAVRRKAPAPQVRHSAKHART